MNSVTNQKIGMVLSFEKAHKHQDNDDNTFYTISAKSTITDCVSEECYSRNIPKYKIGDIITDFVFADTLNDACSITEINEVAVMDYICNKPKIIENIAISISLSLTEDEKVMTMYGEANCQYKEMLEYSDIARDLHSYARRISYDKIVTMSDYQITRYFVMCFLNTLQKCTLDCQRTNPFAEELERMNIQEQKP